MSEHMSRGSILERLRQALESAPLIVPTPPERPASLPLWPDHSPDSDADVSSGPDAWERLDQALTALNVPFRLVRSPGEALEAITGIVRQRKLRSYVRGSQPCLEALGVDNALDRALEQGGAVRLAPEPGEVPCARLAHVDLGLTVAAAALAETGTLVLLTAPDQPRAFSLVPPTHLCLIPKSALLPDISALPALLRRHVGVDGRLPSALTCITGPSSTADIELVVVTGVHGPVAVEAIGLDFELFNEY